MSEHTFNWEAWKVRFDNIDARLEEMKDEMSRLVVKVNNGLTARLNHVEGEIALLKVNNELESRERDKKEKRIARWETAVISVIMAGCVTLGTFIVTQFIREKDKAHEKEPTVSPVRPGVKRPGALPNQ